MRGQRRTRRFMVDEGTVRCKEAKVIRLSSGSKEKFYRQVNQSRGGSQFIAEIPYPLDAKLRLSLRIGANGDTIEDLEARVVWVRKVVDKEWYRTGIEFTDCGRSAQKELRRLAAKYRPLQRHLRRTGKLRFIKDYPLTEKRETISWSENGGRKIGLRTDHFEDGPAPASELPFGTGDTVGASRPPVPRVLPTPSPDLSELPTLPEVPRTPSDDSSELPTPPEAPAIPDTDSLALPTPHTMSSVRLGEIRFEDGTLLNARPADETFRVVVGSELLDNGGFSREVAVEGNGTLSALVGHDCQLNVVTQSAYVTTEGRHFRVTTTKGGRRTQVVGSKRGVFVTPRRNAQFHRSLVA